MQMQLGLGNPLKRYRFTKTKNSNKETLFTVHAGAASEPIGKFPSVTLPEIGSKGTNVEISTFIMDRAQYSMEE